MQKRKEVYDTYWQFAAKRQKIFYQRLTGQRLDNNDPILSHYKFCNVYRATDRVSQYLIKVVIYQNDFGVADQLFRIILFRLLNRINTWQFLEKRLGEISLKNFTRQRYSLILDELKKTTSIYGNAFILCANKYYGFDQKHDNHLALLEEIFSSPKKINYLLDSNTLEELFNRLKELPHIGVFMAYQLAIDCIYSQLFNFNENDFTIAGPGAIRGIQKCFVGVGTDEYQKVILQMVDNQEKEFKRLDLDFISLFGRRLHAIDCQGLFCEVDKYARVKFPQLASNRIRIKAVYQPTGSPIEYFFPPKWQLKVSYRWPK